MIMGTSKQSVNWLISQQFEAKAGRLMTILGEYQIVKLIAALRAFLP
jgi:hypothetical protein